MKIGVITDIHNNVIALEAMLNVFQVIQHGILHIHQVLIELLLQVRE